MPTSLRGTDEVVPAINQSSSAITARRNTRLVVMRGNIGTGGSKGFVDGLESEKRRAGGANRDNVPVPVLLYCFSTKQLFIRCVLNATYQAGARH